MSNNDDDECDSSSLFALASQSDVNSFLRSQAAKITGRTGPSSISDDDDENSMDGSLLARFTQIPMEKKLSLTNPTSIQSKPYLSRSCFASITTSSPIKTSSQKQTLADDLTELKWLNTFKFKEFTINDNKDKDSNDKSATNEQSEENQQQNNDEDRLAKLISELKSYDNENTKINTTSFGILIFLGLYSKRDEKSLPWSLTIKQLYEFAQLNAKQITNKRGWKNSIRQALVTIPCFVKTKRDLLKSRSLWTIDPYYRPLLTKAFLTIPPAPSPSSNKTLSDAATNRHEEQNVTRSSQSILNNFAPKATVKTKVLPRLYERLCEEKVQDDDDGDSDEADSSSHGKRHRSLTSVRKRPRSSSTSPWTSKALKRQKHRHHRSSDVEPKTSTPNQTSSKAVVTPCPSLDHTYLLQSKKLKTSTKKPSTIERTGSIEYEDEDDDDDQEEEDDDDDDEDDERDSSSLKRKSIITTRAQAASRNNSKNRRKSSPPKKRLAIQYPSHRPNTRINRRIIEHDLKLLRQANVLPPLSPPTNQQPLDLSLGPNRSSSYEDIQDKPMAQTPTIDDNETSAQRKTTPIEGVLDLSLSR